jgi:PhnB protein
MLLSNYIFFTTTCEEALAFCTRCDLDPVAQIKRHARTACRRVTRNEAMHGKIMHAK